MGTDAQSTAADPDSTAEPAVGRASRLIAAARSLKSRLARSTAAEPGSAAEPTARRRTPSDRGRPLLPLARPGPAVPGSPGLGRHLRSAGRGSDRLDRGPVHSRAVVGWREHAGRELCPDRGRSGRPGRTSAGRVDRPRLPPGAAGPAHPRPRGGFRGRPSAGHRRAPRIRGRKRVDRSSSGSLTSLPTTGSSPGKPRPPQRRRQPDRAHRPQRRSTFQRSTPAATVALSAEPTPARTKNPDRITFLVVGLDNMPGRAFQNGVTDTMMVVSMDTKTARWP